MCISWAKKPFKLHCRTKLWETLLNKLNETGFARWKPNSRAKEWKAYVDSKYDARWTWNLRKLARNYVIFDLRLAWLFITKSKKVQEKDLDFQYHRGSWESNECSETQSRINESWIQSYIHKYQHSGWLFTFYSFW